MVTTTTNNLYGDWVLDMAGNDTCMHMTEGSNDSNLDKDMMTRHCFLEFLDLLKIIVEVMIASTTMLQ